MWSTTHLHDWTVGACKLQRYPIPQATVYKRTLGVPSNTRNLPTFFAEKGQYYMQVAWLTRAVENWNKRVGSKDDNNMFSRIVLANAHHGFTHEPPVKCRWARQLCDGLGLVQHGVDWVHHMRQLLPINHALVAAWTKQAFGELLDCIHSAHQFSSNPIADDRQLRRHCMCAH